MGAGRKNGSTSPVYERIDQRSRTRRNDAIENERYRWRLRSRLKVSKAIVNPVYLDGALTIVKSILSLAGSVALVRLFSFRIIPIVSNALKIGPGVDGDPKSS